MKKKNKKKLIILVLLVTLLLTTGCTKTLTDKNKKAVVNKVTGQNLTENILCKPTDKETIKQYKDSGVKIDKLPECKDFKVNSGKYEDLWTALLVKPLAFLILKIGTFTKNYALALIILTILIRLICYPFTRKTAMQSENMKKANPEIQRIQKKYEGRKDEDAMMKQSQEMMMVYKKYNINPTSGCIFAFLQLPLFIAFYEAVQRFPVIFEDSFLGMQLGTTPSIGLTSKFFFMYLILMLLIGLTTYMSFKMNSSGNDLDPSMKHMPVYMTAMIIITALFMPSALCIYWLTNNLCTMLQNYIVKKEVAKNK